MLKEWENKYDIYAYDMGRAWQSNLSNATMANVNVLSEMADIIIGFVRFYTMTMLTVLLWISLYFIIILLYHCHFNVRK